jgi:hypothetical protein
MITLTRRALTLFLLLFALSVSSTSSAATLGSFRASDWQGLASSDSARQFERCTATRALKGVSITYSVDREFGWSLRLSNPEWSFIDGAEKGLVLKIDELESLTVRAKAIGKDLLEFRAPDQIRFFADLRLARQLNVVMGGLVFRIPVDGGSEALSALTQCAIRFSRFPINRKPKIVATTALDSGTRAKEAEDLAKLIVSYSRVPNSQFETISGNRSDAAPDAAWVVDRLVTTSIKIVDGANQLVELANEVISTRQKSCEGGGFFFIALPEDVSGMSTARIYNSCQNAEGLSASYDFLVPRPKGGYFLINETTKGNAYILEGFRLLRAYAGNLRAVVPVSVRALSESGQAPDPNSKTTDEESSHEEVEEQPAPNE